MPAHIEITAIYRNQKFRWDDTVLIECELVEKKANQPVEVVNGQLNGRANGSSLQFASDPFDNFSEYITIKTEADEGELKPGVEYRWLGSYTNYTHPRTRKTEKQFLAKSFTRATPHGREGIVRYLVDAPWVGNVFARKLWDKFGSDAVRMLRESPLEVAAAVGLIPARAEEAAAWLEKEKRIEDCKIGLADLLAGRGFPKGTIRLAIKNWGNAAADHIRKNPYRLMLFRGCGFAKTDKLYLELKHNPAALKRQALCAWYALDSDQEGHTWQTEGYFCQKLRDRISGANCNPKAAFAIGRRAPLGSPLLAGRRDENSRVWFAEGKRARNEMTVAIKVAMMMADTSTLWPDVSGIDAADHQREQLAAALLARIGVFIGTPGTGKTRTAAQLVALIIKHYGQKMIAVAAPTGKAAVRITEAMNEYGIDLKARTIHSLLGVASHADGDGWGFEHGEHKPLPFQFIIIDESSMKDIDLLASFLRACDASTHVLFVGDTNQLPPVGHGAPLRDFIAVGVPCGELTEIWRNAGTIVKACQAIRFGKSFQPDEQLIPQAGKNLKLLEAAGGEASARRIIEAIRNIRDTKKADPIWEVQVIVAVNEKSPLSRKVMNRLLQDELNPDGESVQGSPFRVGDKIICLKNGLMPLADSFYSDDSEDDLFDSDSDDKQDKVFVANGELGCVLEVEPKRTIAQFNNPHRVIVIPRGGSDKEESAGDGEKGSGCNFDLGYAISCHKSQGSEWPIVIIALDEYPGARMVCSREWIYTGISRAKLACFLVGRLQTAYSFCKTDKLSKRKTFLVERIKEELESLSLAARTSLAARAETENDETESESGTGIEKVDIKLPVQSLPEIVIEQRATS
jgi:exodeoxyribonuclease V alpha subunit